MAQLIWNGIAIGALYGLIAIGYTLLFGIIQVIFFAQGELSMLAAFAAFWVIGLVTSEPSTGGLILLLFGAVLAAAAVSVAGGLFSEFVAIRPLRDAPRVKPLITSLGMSIVFQNAIMLWMGPQPFPFLLPALVPRWIFLGIHISLIEILMIVSAVGCMLAVDTFLKHHRYGLAIRAISQSPVGARLMGVNTNRAVMVTFMISSLTAAVAGVFMATYYGIVRFDIGFVPGIKGFTIAILGGVGNVRGAIIAGFLVGIAEALFSGFASPDYRDLFVFAVLVLTLVLRPKGLLGEGS